MAAHSRGLAFLEPENQAQAAGRQQQNADRRGKAVRPQIVRRGDEARALRGIKETEQAEQGGCQQDAGLEKNHGDLPARHGPVEKAGACRLRMPPPVERKVRLPACVVYAGSRRGSNLLFGRFLDVSGYLVIYLFVGLVILDPLVAGDEFGDHGLARREFLEFL